MILDTGLFNKTDDEEEEKLDLEESAKLKIKKMLQGKNFEHLILNHTQITIHYILSYTLSYNYYNYIFIKVH